MGRGGRNKKPTALHILEGTSPRVGGDSPKPEPALVTTPGWLGPEARRLWRSLAPELSRLGLLTPLDRAAFAGYCQMYARWREAEKVLAVEGLTLPGHRGVLRKHPMVTIARQALETMRRFGEDFGLSPASRDRLRLKPLAQEEDAEFEALLDGEPGVPRCLTTFEKGDDDAS